MGELHRSIILPQFQDQLHPTQISVQSIPWYVPTDQSHKSHDMSGYLLHSELEAMAHLQMINFPAINIHLEWFSHIKPGFNKMVKTSTDSGFFNMDGPLKKQMVFPVEVVSGRLPLRMDLQVNHLSGDLHYRCASHGEGFTEDGKHGGNPWETKPYLRETYILKYIKG